MQTLWDYTLQTEALRILHCAHQIAVGFYKINGFIPLPHIKNLKSDRLVSFPYVNYMSIPRFWERVKKIGIDTLPIQAPTSLVDQTTRLIQDTNLPKPNFSSTKKIWDAYQPRILNQIFELIPQKKGKVSKIIIMPTAFGTSCSFNIHRKPGDPIIIWLRHDKGVAEIVEAILTSLTRDDVYTNLGGLWQESEIIVDWMLTYSPLGKLLSDLKINVTSALTIKSTRSVQSTNYVQQSEAFLHSLGTPTVDISTLKTLPVNNMSHREREIFNLLLSKSPDLVTVDEIAEILFANNPEAFSMYAIAKSIQRLRDKLERNGVSGSYIQTRRGEGYMLIN